MKNKNIENEMITSLRLIINAYLNIICFKICSFIMPRLDEGPEIVNLSTQADTLGRSIVNYNAFDVQSKLAHLR